MAITQASRTCPETPQHHQDSTQGSATSDLWCGRVRPLDEYQRFGVPKDVWYSYTGKQQKRHMKKFTITTKERLVRSTNSEKVVVEPKHKGKKQGQLKCKSCNRTLSVSKRRQLNRF
ncbi:hypothetical protein PoB_006397100 [Plakobranchus ocellatus]|uniref:Uncharacterized protein n=1 Tax=Plakobranchus ocellatus TaxID=259542 RepID=A0AAV4CZS5_9GAST|nr:hypothetical protein PoB_006397100 [Plakobranchus ocellatus]